MRPIETRIVRFVFNSINHSNSTCRNVLRVKLLSVNSTFAANYQYLSFKFGLTEADWYTSLDHLLGKVKKKITLFRHEIFLEFRNFPDLRGHSRGNHRSGLIFMGGGEGTIYCVCSLTVSNVGTTQTISSLSTYFIYTKSSQVPGVCFTSTCTSIS